MSKENPLFVFIVSGTNNVWIKKDAGKATRFLNDFGKGITDVGRGIRENIAPVRWLGEKLFNGYGEQMEQLREVDEQINAWTRDLDNALDQARDARKQGRYLDVLFWLNQINNRLRHATEAGKSLVDMHQEKFDEYFGKTNHGLKDYMGKINPEDLEDPNQSFERLSAFVLRDELISTGGFFGDMGDQITTWKMERMHKKRLQEMKRAMEMLLGVARTTVGHVDAMLSRMSKARANGDMNTYVESLGKIGDIQKRFETQFQKTYETKGFKEMVDRMRARDDRVKQEESNKPRELAVQNLGEAFEEEAAAEAAKKTLLPNAPSVENVKPETVVPAINGNTLPGVQMPIEEKNQKRIEDITKDVLSTPPSIVDPSKSEPLMQDLSVENTAGDLPIAPAEVAEPILTSDSVPIKTNTKPKSKAKSKKSELEVAILKTSHVKFYAELGKAAVKNDPYLLAAMMLDYSQKIDESDPQKSLELLSIAEGILNV